MRPTSHLQVIDLDPGEKLREKLLLTQPAPRPPPLPVALLPLDLSPVTHVLLKQTTQNCSALKRYVQKVELTGIKLREPGELAQKQAVPPLDLPLDLSPGHVLFKQTAQPHRPSRRG